MVGTNRLPTTSRMTKAGRMSVTTAREALLIRTAIRVLSPAPAANKTLPRIEGTYHSHSASVEATDICPTKRTPSMGPSIQISHRTNSKVALIVINARAPRLRSLFKPCVMPRRLTGALPDLTHTHADATA